MPPTPSSGRMAIASTMMPRPPYQCSACRHRLTAGGSVSRPFKIVAPVVVRPDMVSKKACVNDSPGRISSSGSVADADMMTQPRVTSRKPSRGFSSRAYGRVTKREQQACARAHQSREREIPRGAVGHQQRGDDRQHEAGGKDGEQQTQYVCDPQHARRALTAAGPRNKPLDRLDVTAVGEEQDDVVVARRAPCRDAP